MNSPHHTKKRKGPAPVPVAERFWNKVDIREPDECWEWQGYRLLHRYGRVSVENRKIAYTHRVAWELTHGPVPGGMHVLHLCDNPPCVNPAHLFLGTLSDNTQDMLSKKRHCGPKRCSN